MEVKEEEDEEPPPDRETTEKNLLHQMQLLDDKHCNSLLPEQARGPGPAPAFWVVEGCVAVLLEVVSAPPRWVHPAAHRASAVVFAVPSWRAGCAATRLCKREKPESSDAVGCGDSPG